MERCKAGEQEGTDRMDRKEAVEILRNTPIDIINPEENVYSKYFTSLILAIEALQEKDHRCDNCSNGENAGVRIYCLLHTSFHRLDEYCSEWRQK